MEIPDGTSWLDTKTKAAMQKLPPEKLAPATTGSFAVVVLSLGAAGDRVRQALAFERVLRTSREEAERQTKRRSPFVATQELTLADAMLAQFELICADVIAVILSDRVVANAEREYLASLYREMLHWDEFQALAVRVVSIPNSAKGEAFVRQFLGMNVPRCPFVVRAMRKKARIMNHWANKIGAKVQVAVEA